MLPPTAEKMTQDEFSRARSPSPRPPINAQCTADLYFPCSSCLKWIVILLLMRVIHLRLFDGYFISPKYILYKRINSNKLDPLTSSEQPVFREGAVRLRPEEMESMTGLPCREPRGGIHTRLSESSRVKFKFILESKGDD